MTGIEWTDATWNPVRGCSRVSEGCRNCYAERQAARFRGDDDPFHGFAYSDKSGPHWTGRVELIPSKLDEPLRWRKPRRVFVNSMSDLFHERLPDEDIAAIFGVMAACPQHTFQILTKRPERMRRWFEWATPCLVADAARNQAALPAHFMFRCDTNARLSSWPLPNVWLGVSVENQATADERIPLLLQTPAALRFVSYEPALGPVDFERWLTVWGVSDPASGKTVPSQLDWLIFGGESGPGARPCDLAWARSAREQCKAAGVPFFMKQAGARPIDPGRWPDRARTLGVDACDVKLYNRKGADLSELPENLRVREFPALHDSGREA